MDSEQIKYLLQLAKDLNFTKASNHLFVSQSTVSKKIMSLENELGFDLFIRNQRNVKLTENGKQLVKFFEKYKQEYLEQLQIAKYRINQEKKIIRIGVIEGYNLMKYFSHFHSECSFLDYQIDFERIDALIEHLNQGEYDLIIGQYKGIQQEIKNEELDNIICEHLCEVQRIIYFSRKNPLYNKQDISLKNFINQPFYIGKSLVAFQNAQEICAKEKINPKLIPIKHQATIEYEVSKGNGFALGDECSKIMKDQDFTYFKIPHYQQIGCAFRNDIDHKKKVYIDEIINVFKKINSILE